MQRYALALVVAPLFALPVHGAITLVSSTREVSTVALVALDPSQPGTAVASYHDYIPGPGAGLFQQNLYNVLSDPAYGTISSMASQMSCFSLAPDNQRTGASFAATSAVTAATFSPYGSHTNAFSVAYFHFRVTDAPVDYDLAIGLAPLGSPAGSAVQLWDVKSCTILLAVGSDLAQNSGIHATGTLQPGLYQLVAWTGFTVDAPAASNVAHAGSASYNLALTPEPVSPALLALGGLALLRRRR
jgi:hypothetical protein